MNRHAAQWNRRGPGLDDSARPQLESIADAGGGSAMTPVIARKVVVDIQRTDPVENQEHSLTPHEARIVGMLADGNSYQEVGERLGITINTVRNYIRSIYEKLQVHTKSEAVSRALRGGLIS